jgi:hypothetical protein
MRKKFIGGGRDAGLGIVLIILVIILAILYGEYKLFKEKLSLSNTVTGILLVISFFALAFLALFLMLNYA